jgi:hypothetical protein
MYAVRFDPSQRKVHSIQRTLSTTRRRYRTGLVAFELRRSSFMDRSKLDIFPGSCRTAYPADAGDRPTDRRLKHHWVLYSRCVVWPYHAYLEVKVLASSCWHSVSKISWRNSNSAWRISWSQKALTLSRMRSESVRRMVMTALWLALSANQWRLSTKPLLSLWLLSLLLPVWRKEGSKGQRSEQWAALYSEITLSRKQFGIGHMYTYNFFCLEWLILWSPRILTFPPGIFYWSLAALNLMRATDCSGPALPD